MIRKMIEKWKRNRGERAVAKAIAVLATAPRAAVSIPTKQAFFDNNDAVRVVIQDSLSILVHRGDIEVVTNSGTVSFWGSDSHRPYLQAGGEFASAPLFTTDEVVRNICANINIQAKDPGGEVFCITMYNHVFHDDLSWGDARRAAESMTAVIRDAASVMHHGEKERGDKATGRLYSSLFLAGEEEYKNTRKANTALAISEAVYTLRVVSTAHEVREFLIMLSQEQHLPVDDLEEEW